MKLRLLLAPGDNNIPQFLQPKWAIPQPAKHQSLLLFQLYANENEMDEDIVELAVIQARIYL